MPLQYDEIGQRLRAFRLGSGLSADEVADRLGISRTALYRFEKGELAKIETLERLSELLQVSLPTLLGVGIEYIPSAVSYFERVRQLEETAEHIVVLAGPISFLLGSDSFEMALEQVLQESIPDNLPNRGRALTDVDKIMEILHERKRAYRHRRPPIVNLISAMQIEPFLNNGLVGRVSLTESKKSVRREMARAEVEHFASVIEEEFDRRSNRARDRLSAAKRISDLPETLWRHSYDQPVSPRRATEHKSWCRYGDVGA